MQDDENGAEEEEDDEDANPEDVDDDDEEDEGKNGYLVKIVSWTVSEHSTRFNYLCDLPFFPFMPR